MSCSKCVKEAVRILESRMEAERDAKIYKEIAERYFRENPCIRASGPGEDNWYPITHFSCEDYALCVKFGGSEKECREKYLRKIDK
jgi:hypothetical protein